MSARSTSEAGLAPVRQKEPLLHPGREVLVALGFKSEVGGPLWALHVPRNAAQSQTVPQQCGKGPADGRGAGSAGREVGPDVPGLEALLGLADVQGAALAYLEVKLLPRLWSA
jgi:hypothetical protein